MYLIAEPNAGVNATVVRPDGYLSYSSSRIDTDDLAAHLSSTFGASVSTTETPDLR